MRQEVGAARLLPQGKDRPEGDRRCQQGACQPGPRVEQQEVEGHQREAGGRMGARKAAAGRQVVRPVVEEVHIRMHAAKADDISRAVHVGGELEDAHDRGTERDGNHEVSGFPAEWTQPFDRYPPMSTTSPARATARTRADPAP